MGANPFDAGIIRFLNSFAQRSWTFDALMVLLIHNNLLKGVVVVALFWWGWTSAGAAKTESRAVLLFGMFASVFGVIVSRILTLMLPFRERPLHDPALQFQLPYTMNPQTLIDWSSFPSDHMVLYTCLAASLWMVNRRIGTVALFYSLFLIGLPRVYTGAHYPTDVLIGALLGIGFAALAYIPWARKAVTSPGLFWLEAHPPSFYAFLFICTYEIAEVFDSSRRIIVEYISHAWKLL